MSDKNEQQQGQQQAAPAPAKIKVVVDGHEHGGQPVEKGAVIEVPEAVAKMLVEAKVAARA